MENTFDMFIDTLLFSFRKFNRNTNRLLTEILTGNVFIIPAFWQN